MGQAIEKFLEAARSFKKADEKARRGGRSNIDVQAFQLIMIDLDAAIPDLQGAYLGRALVLKANCIYWIYTGEIRKSAKKTDIFDVRQWESSPINPLLQEGLTYATKGYTILEELGHNDELPWANDIVNIFKEISNP